MTAVVEEATPAASGPTPSADRAAIPMITITVRITAVGTVDGDTLTVDSVSPEKS